MKRASALRRARRIAGRASRAPAAAFVVLLAACGVPTDDTSRPIAPENIPFGLADVTTSTSTTIASPDRVPEAGINGQSVRLYFAADNQFVAVDRMLPAPATLERVLEELADGPGPDDGGLRSVVGADDIASVELKAGVATVSLTSRFPELPPSEQRLAVAQLVLTLTSRPGVGQVAFSLEDQSVGVPRADGSITLGYVSRDDYRTLLRD